MREEELRTSIKTVYGMLWDVLALYEKTSGYNEIPSEEKNKEIDIWDYMGEKLLDIRKKVDVLFLGETEVKEKLTQIVDETEVFVRKYEIPGVVTRWKKINPRILYFDCAFDLKKACPKEYSEIAMGLCDAKLACYPDEKQMTDQEKYFSEIQKKNEDGNLGYSEERIFQNELLRTLTLVFEEDFEGWL